MENEEAKEILEPEVEEIKDDEMEPNISLLCDILASIASDSYTAQIALYNETCDNPNPFFVPRYRYPEIGNAILKGYRQFRDDFHSSIMARRLTLQENDQLILPELSEEEELHVRIQLASEGIADVRNAILKVMEREVVKPS